MPYAPHETVSDAIKRAGLPKDHDIHWSAARKEEVVRAVRDKLISFDEARWRYLLSKSEFESWAEQVDRRDRRKQAVPMRRRPLVLEDARFFTVPH